MRRFIIPLICILICCFLAGALSGALDNQQQLAAARQIWQDLYYSSNVDFATYSINGQEKQKDPAGGNWWDNLPDSLPFLSI